MTPSPTPKKVKALAYMYLNVAIKNLLMSTVQELFVSMFIMQMRGCAFVLCALMYFGYKMFVFV